MLDFSKNYFELFGLPVGYIVDSGQLADHYRELQRVVHPDRYAHGSATEKRFSVQGAAMINEAYQTLKDPILRARYLLLLNGIDVQAEQGTTQDAAFLMEQLELRETLASARDADQPYVVISELVSGINRRINSLVGQMALRFESVTSEQLQEAEEILRKMQFLQKLRLDAEALEAELDEAF